MEVERKRQRTERISIEQHSSAGMVWFAGWLFTLAFLKLSFWKAVLALFIWPWYLGDAARALLAGG